MVLVVVVLVAVGVRVRVCRRGLRVLEHGFTRQYGWEGAGAPRKLLRLDNLPKAVAARMNSAEMLRCDCWDSVGAAGDQVHLHYTPTLPCAWALGAAASRSYV